MNKVIKALFIQAGGAIEEENGNLWTYCEDLDPEKFAELIVRDCMDVVDGYTKTRTFNTHYDAVEQIEALFGIKHFGVTE
jgi:hypothetical protein